MTKYQRALLKEKRRGIVLFALWALTTLIGPLVTQGGWRVVWFIVVVLWILGLFKHYNAVAIHSRAYYAMEKEE